MTWLDYASLVLVFLPVIDWTAVWALHRFTRWFPDLRTARERRTVALAIAVLTTVFAFLALVRLGHIVVPNDVVAFALLFAVIGLSSVNAMFLWRYRHALFRRTPPEEPPAD